MRPPRSRSRRTGDSELLFVTSLDPGRFGSPSGPVRTRRERWATRPVEESRGARVSRDSVPAQARAPDWMHGGSGQSADAPYGRVRALCHRLSRVRCVAFGRRARRPKEHRVVRSASVWLHLQRQPVDRRLDARARVLLGASRVARPMIRTISDRRSAARDHQDALRAGRRWQGRSPGVSERDCERISSAFAYPVFRQG